MLNKPTTKLDTEQVHQLPAGILPGDKATELIACRETKKVFGLHNGRTIPFNELPSIKRAMILGLLMDDDMAMQDLQHLSGEEAVEHYAFCLYGAADSVPDFNDKGELGRADNFICGNGCEHKCLKWKSKKITVDDKAISPRQLKIVNLLASDMPDKVIADHLGITESTLDSHKSNLYKLFNVPSRPALVLKAAKQKILQ